MKKLKGHLKLIIVSVLVLSVCSVKAGEKTNIYALETKNSTAKETIIQDIGINTASKLGERPIDRNANVEKLQRKTISRYSNIIQSSDSILNKKKSLQTSYAVASTSVPSCISGVTSTANVSTSTQFKNALESQSITCIVITANFSINMTAGAETFATTNVNKTIVSDANMRTISISIPTTFVGFTPTYKNLFKSSNVYSITLYNLKMEYSSTLDSSQSNFNMFYGFDSINILSSQIIHGRSSLSSSNNLAPLIGHTSALSNKIRIENSEITGSTGLSKIISSNNIDIKNSVLTLHVENTDAIYAIENISVLESSNISITGYNQSNAIAANKVLIAGNSMVTLSKSTSASTNITGIKAEVEINMSSSTFLVNYTGSGSTTVKALRLMNNDSVLQVYNSSINSSTHGNTIEILGNNSIVNFGESVLTTSTNSNTIFSSGDRVDINLTKTTITSTAGLNTISATGNNTAVLIGNQSVINHNGSQTAINMGELNDTSFVSMTKSSLILKQNSSVFIGESLNLNESKIELEGSVRFSNSSYYFMRANNLLLENLSTINFNSDSNLFLTGIGNGSTNLSLKNSKLNLDVDQDYVVVLVPGTTFVANLGNLEVESSEINIYHSGNRFVELTNRANTLGFATVNGNANIIGSSNKFVVKNVKTSGSTKRFVNYSEGFGKDYEHTFLKLISNSQMFLNNASLVYDGNVSFISTEKNIVLTLTNSEIKATMAEQAGENFTSAHSFVSLKNRTTGSIAISLENSKMEVIHKSNYVKADTLVLEVKPTISIFDDVLLNASEEPKITVNATRSKILINDISNASFISGDANDASILGDKLDHNAVPLEISSINLNSNSSFEYQNNHEFYPVVRTKNFVSNNSSVSFKVAGNFHSNTGTTTSIQASNYYHLMYDGIVGTIFDFNLNRDSSNYSGGTLKFLSAINRNIFNSRILTNESANITATIDYLNTVTYGGSDVGREFIPYLPMVDTSLMQTITIKGNRLPNSSTYVAQSETNTNLSTVNMYQADVPVPPTITNSTTSNIFFANTNRRREVIFGDYVVKFDESIIYDQTNNKYYLYGFASPNTILKVGSNSAVYEGGTLPTGLVRFKLEIPSNQIATNITIVSQNVVKEGNSSAGVTGNPNPQLHLTRHYHYQGIEPKLDLGLEPSFDTLIFNNQNLTMVPQYLNRTANNIFKINVTDTRYNSPGWELRLCVDTELVTFSNGAYTPLYNPLTFKHSDNTYTDLTLDCDNGLLIAENNASNNAETLIQWDNTQGIQLNIKDPSLILKAKEYTGIVKLILQSK